ncbi:Subtilisin-like protease SBT2.5 [Sesamum alatum]|uniref:Subtilisin-like protease SBT2.5 n=1 Tax=Sesamum alatum TaxID=300844 RepID=A0AAE2CSC0_9LAMI|nr:Subtilisin-like protease SBT2.5 [Sesamum alatum]
MTLRPSASRKFFVTLTVRSVTGAYSFGEVLLKGSRGHKVRIPIVSHGLRSIMVALKKLNMRGKNSPTSGQSESGRKLEKQPCKMEVLWAKKLPEKAGNAPCSASTKKSSRQYQVEPRPAVEPVRSSRLLGKIEQWQQQLDSGEKEGPPRQNMPPPTAKKTDQRRLKKKSRANLKLLTMCIRLVLVRPAP